MDDTALLFRQPITNRARELLGYDLVLISPHGERAASGGVAGLLEGVAPDKGFLARLPNRFALADCAQVEAEQADAAPGRFVLSTRADGSIEDLPTVTRKWKAAGFGLCLDTTAQDNWPQQVLDQASFVRLDQDLLDGHLEDVSGRLRKHQVKQIAASVRSRSRYEAAVRAGCELFEGYFFTEPSADQAPAATPAYSSIVTLMKLAQDNAPTRQLEEVLKRDATLSFKLLRYINSVGFGLSCEIQSFRHAVTLLGYQNLYKWLALLLVTAARRQSAAALVTTSIARGRLAELLGQSLFDAQEQDSLFIAGAFSLLHAVLQVPLEQVAEQVSLSQAVTDALFRHEGPYGPILELVEQTERLDQPAAAEHVAQLAASLGITHAALNRAQLDALVWAEGLAT